MTAPDVAVVTGGAGFIGSHMVDLLLSRGFEVRVIDDLSGGKESNLADHASEPRLSLERQDIRRLDPESSLFRGARLVFHFAGIGDIVPSIERPLDYLSVNAMGTVHVLECARHAAVEKLVYAASSSCYGLASVPTREDHPIAPQYPYALSKVQGEEAVLHWHRVYGLPACSIRIFNAYGLRSRTTGAYGAVFGVFLKQKLEEKPLTVVGDGTQTRDFIYVTDVANAFLRVGESGTPGATYNVGSGNPQSVLRLVELLGGDVVHIPTRPGEPGCTWADRSRISKELGWEPTVPFEEGVRRMLERIDDWRDAPLWDEGSIRDATTQWFTFLSR